MPRFYNKKVKLLLPLILVITCILYQIHQIWLVPVNQNHLELLSYHHQVDSHFDPKLSTYHVYNHINNGGKHLSFHWDDYVDLSPGNSMLDKFKSSGVCDKRTEAYGSVNSYWLESYNTKVLRSMTNLFCLKDIPKQIFVRTPSSYVKIPVVARERYGQKLNDTFEDKIVDQYEAAEKSGLTSYPLKKLNKTVPIDVEDFYFDPQHEIMKLASQQSLSTEEFEYFEFLKYANSIVDNSDRYFKYPWIYSDVVQGNSHHLAAPFFKRFIPIRERQSIIQHMIRAWFEFAQSIDVPSWINYGSLLGWAYNGVNMPWDTDVDIQLSIRHLDYLLRHFNNSLVFEDPKFGNAKYLLEISPTYVRQGNGRNFIDGRFIDVNSGLYIDISAVSHTNFKPPANLADKDEILVHCKHFNWHSLNEILPLRHTYFEGSSVYIPHNISSLLSQKYGRESFTTKSRFLGYNYQKDINLWVSDEICTEAPRMKTRYEINENNEIDETRLSLAGACNSKLLQDEYMINYQYGQRHKQLNGDIDTPIFYDIEMLGDLPITRKDAWDYYNDLAMERVSNTNWFHEYSV